MRIRIIVSDTMASLPYEVEVVDADGSYQEGLVAAFRHKGDAELFRMELRRRAEVQGIAVTI